MSQNRLRHITGSTTAALVVTMLMPGVFSGIRPVSADPSTALTRQNRLPDSSVRSRVGSVSDQDLRSVSRLKAAIRRLKAKDKEDDEDEARERRSEIAYRKAVALARTKHRPLPKKPKEIEKSVDYLEAYLSWLKVRAYPRDTVDLAAYRRAVLYRETMHPFIGLRTRLQTIKGRIAQDVPLPPIQWQFIGPRNLQVPYQQYYGTFDSYTSGRINGLAFHPTNSNTVYLASGGGGLWKTMDGGANWTNISKTFPTQNTSHIAVDPNNSANVYVGLGDFDGFRGTIGGIMKSTNSGSTWTLLPQGTTALNSSFISGLAIDPDNSNHIVASAGRSSVTAQIFHSTDGGATWGTANWSGGTWSDLKISPVKTSSADPTHPSSRFYYVANDGNGVWNSVDGTTWNPIAAFPNSSAGYRYIRIAPSTTDPNVVYAIESNQKLVYKGVRTPATDTYAWTSISTGFPNGYSGNTNYNWSQDFYDIHLEAVPQQVSGITSDVLYNGLITISGKQGNNNWQDIGVTYTGSAQTHNDQHAFAAFPNNPNIMMFGNDGGVYGLTYTPATGAYTISEQLSSTLGVTMFYYGDFHPTNPTWAIGGSQDNATPVATGDTGNWGNVGGGDGAGVAINPLNPLYQYATVYGGGFYWSRDGWNSEGYTGLPNNSDGSNDGPFTPRVTVDPNYPNPVYFGGSNFLHRYNEPGVGGSGWETPLGNFNFGSQLLAISIAPSNSRVLYVGTSSALLYTSTDRGATWRKINSNLPALAITDVWVNPKNANDAIAVLSGTGADHVWRCTNTAAASPTWTDMSGSGGGLLPDIPTNTIARDFIDPNTFYVGTDIGVFATSDSGTTWTDATTALGLPNVQVTTLKALSGTGYLMAATYGRGMWRIPLTSSLPDLVPDLRLSRTISKVGGNYSIAITLTNVGGATATTPTITAGTLKIGALTTNTSSSLPLTMGSIDPGTSNTATLTFPISAGTSGAAGVFTVKGTFTYGTKTGALSGSSRVTLP